MSRGGSLRQDPESGLWSFVVDVSPLGAPRKQVRRRGFKTKREAQQALTEVLHTLGAGTFVQPSELTVARFVADWLESLEVAGRAPATIASYRRQFRLHILPALGAARLQQLTALDVDRMYAGLLKGGRADGQGGLSPRSVRYVHSVLGAALRDAQRKGLVAQNVARAATPPSAKAARGRDMNFWEPAELRTFLEWLRDRNDDLYPLVRLASMSGMRRGEVCGLLWADVDLDDAKVKVRRQLSSIDGALVFSEHPKTDRGRRTISIDAETVAVLRAHKARQSERRLALGPGWRDTGLVFTSLAGESVDPDSIGKTFARRVARARVSPIRFHDLRHSHCAHLVAANVNVKAVSARMGHASVAFTLDRYAHLMPEADQHAADAVASLVAGVTIP